MDPKAQQYADIAKQLITGAQNGRAKLTPQQVIAIRTNPSGMKSTRLAEIYGVSSATISLIRSNKRW